MRHRIIAVLLYAASSLAAQDRMGVDAVRLAGRVLDENNAPLSGAEITLKQGSAESHTFADPTGGFSLTAGQPGEYSINVALPGYFSLLNRIVVLNPGTNELTLVLSRLRERLESLDVSGTSAVIDMDKTVRDQRLSSAELLDIPYRNNNDLRNAVRVLPGVVQDRSGSIHVNGASEQQVLYTLDSFTISDPLSGTFQSRLSVEGVQSVSVLSGAIPAEYGKGAAGVLSINTKNGDDQFRYSATNFLPGVELRKGLTIGSWTPRFNLSGPVRKGKVWFSDSLTTQYTKDIIRGLPAGQDTNTSWRYSNMLHVQANLSPSNILYGGFLANYWTSPNSGLGALDPQQTTVSQRASQWFYDLRDQIYFGKGSLLEFGYGSNHTFGREVPQGSEYYLYTPGGRLGNYFVNGRQRSNRDQWMANYFLPSFHFYGSHQFKTGTDLDSIGYWQDINRTGFIDYRSDRTAARVVSFAGNGLVRRSNFEASSYLQDSWRMRPGLLLELGVRMDRDRILHNWSVAPRTGFAWAPFHLEHTKLSGGFGIIYSATNLFLFTRPQDQYPISTFYPDSSGLPLSTVSSYRIDRGLDTPHYLNANLAWEQRWNSTIVTTVQGIARRGLNGLSYADTTGLAAATIYRLRDDRNDNYNAVEFTIRQNLRRQYQWLASYTRSVSRSTAVLDLTPDQPLIVGNNTGRLPWDAPNRFLSWGLLPTPWKDWSFAYLAEWRTGFPFSVVDDRGVVLGNVNTRRFPDYFDLDVAVEHEFDLRGQRWACRLGLNNASSSRNPDTVNNNVDTPQFLRFYGGQGRSLNIRVRWLGKT